MKAGTRPIACHPAGTASLLFQVESLHLLRHGCGSIAGQAFRIGLRDGVTSTCLTP